jgi:hypothetical protein
VSPEGITTDPEKLEAVRNWPTPRNKHQIRSFLGLCTYYRRFISGFADIAKPLTRLTEEKRAYQWTPEVEALCTAPILAYLQPGGKFIVDMDASNVGLGGVLSQLQDGQERVISYYSETLNKAERNYCVTRWELLAIVKSLKHFLSTSTGKSSTCAPTTPH